MSDKTWKTAITSIKPNEIRVRGYRIDELLGRVSLAGGIFLLFHGNLPTPAEERLFDAMLLAGIDHGVTPPSAQAARIAASTGAPLNGALAAGVLSINKHHGAAIEPAMRMFLYAKDLMEASKKSPEGFAKEYVRQALEQKKRLAGFGHRVHTDDPRTKRLLELAKEAGKDGMYMKLAQLIGAEVSAQMGKPLPLNVDGAIGALLCELDFPVEVSNFFFILPRVAGMAAHYHEEITREKPMRNIVSAEAEYDGPAPREMEKK